MLPPLRVGEHTLGLLTLTFVAGEVTDDAQQAFVKAVAGALAQAMERALAIHSARGRDAGGHPGQHPVVLPGHRFGRSVLEPRASAQRWNTLSSLLVPHSSPTGAYSPWPGTAGPQTVAVYHGDPDRGAAAQSLAARDPRELEGPDGGLGDHGQR